MAPSPRFDTRTQAEMLFDADRYEGLAHSIYATHALAENFRGMAADARARAAQL